MPFRNVVADAGAGLVLKPLIQSYLHRQEYPDFNVRFKKEGPRAPDGYFHPSTHPGLTARQLFYYMTAPERWQEEPLGYMGRMSVTMGTAMHLFVQEILGPRHAKLLLKPADAVCLVCGRRTGWGPTLCNEHGVVDADLGSRGHMDGMVAVPPGLDLPRLAGWEFKTSGEGGQMKMGRMEDNDIESFRAKWPDYWWQAQNYMMITGLAMVILTMLGLGHPWPMMEMQIPRDEFDIEALRQKYRLVRHHVAEGTPPEPCCSPGSKEAKACPARAACPIGRMSL